MSPQIIYGKNAVLEALKAKRRKMRVCYLEGEKNRPGNVSFFNTIQATHVPIELVDKKKVRSLAQSDNHQGVAALMDDYPYVPFEELAGHDRSSSLLLLCDSVADPQNFGAICRTAFCFGADGVVIAKNRSVDVTATVVKASAGAVEHLPISKVTNLNRALDYLKEKGFWSYAADAAAKDSIDSLDPAPRSVVILGSEGEGIRPLLSKSCDFRFAIPLARNFDSLNVAQAATVILYEFSRQRAKLTP